MPPQYNNMLLLWRIKNLTLFEITITTFAPALLFVLNKMKNIQCGSVFCNIFYTKLAHAVFLIHQNVV